MSSPILPIRGLSGLPTDMPSVATSTEDIDALVSEMTASGPSRGVIASRGGPPPDLLEQIAAAGEIEEQLRSGGHRLRFSSMPSGQRTLIEVCDCDGNAVRTVSAAEALDIAAGKPLD
jgi:hypothetical protein